MRRRQTQFDVPVELRFIDLFLVIIAALLFVMLVLLWRGIGIAAPPRVVTRALPTAFKAEQYEVPLAATDGTPPLSWALVAGALPDGLELRNGSIVGHAETPGVHLFAVKVSDAEGRSDSAELTVEVKALDRSTLPTLSSLRIANRTALLPDGKSGEPYSFALTVVNGVAPFRWSLAGGALPGGLHLSDDGVVSGTPVVPPPPYYRVLFKPVAASRITPGQPGSVALSVSVEDSQGRRLQQAMFLYVEPGPHSRWWPLAVAFFVLVLCLGLFTLSMFVLGFPEQSVPGWRGLFFGKRQDKDWQAQRLIPRFLAPFVITSRKIVNAALCIRVEGGILFASGWRWAKDWTGSPPGGRMSRSAGPETGNGGTDATRTPKARKPRMTTKLARRRSRLAALRMRREGIHGQSGRDHGAPRGDSALHGGGGAPPQATASESAAADRPERSAGVAGGTLPRPEQPPTMEEQDYLDSLKIGGKVRYGGGFLALAYIEKMGLTERVEVAFDSLPALGRGLLHVSLDSLLQCLLDLSPPPVAESWGHSIRASTWSSVAGGRCGSRNAMHEASQFLGSVGHRHR